MPAETWNDNSAMCAACSKTQIDLPKYTCPRCERKGCSNCMPAGEAEPCPYCVEATQYEQYRHLM